MTDEDESKEAMRKAVHLLGRAFRETGQALDRLGLTVAEKEIFQDTFARHRPVMNLFDKVPLSTRITKNSTCRDFLILLFDAMLLTSCSLYIDFS